MKWFVSVLALAIAFVAPVSANTEIVKEEISDSLRSQLKLPLGKKTKELREKKNDIGAAYIYGSYYDDFEPTGDGGYNVTYITRTSETDELIAERTTLTLREQNGKWEIADEKHEQRIEGYMYRSIPGDETFHRFDSLNLDREGLKLSGGPGDVIVDYRQGQPFRIRFSTDSKMTYDYMTPVELGWFNGVLKRQLEKHPKDILFDVEDAMTMCSAEVCEELMAEMFTGLREVPLEQLSSKNQREYTEFLTELRKSRKEFPLAGYRLKDGPDARWFSLSIKKDGRDHWANLTYDNGRRQEMSFTVSRLGDRNMYGFPLFVYNSKETREAKPDPYEIERKDSVNVTPQGRFAPNYDVIGLTGSVEMAIVDPEMMTCDFTYEIEAKEDMDFLPFFVAQAPRQPGQDTPTKTPTLNVKVMEDGEGNDLTYVRGGRTNGLIFFPEPIKKGDRVKIHVDFDNGNSIYKYNHTYSRVNRGGWAPFVSFTDNIEYLDLEIATESKYQILGIDNKVSERVENGKRIERYKSDFPLTFPTIIFGDYESDSSNIQAKKLDGTPIPVRVHVDKTSMRTATRTSWGGSGSGETVDDFIDRAGADNRLGVRDIRRDALAPIGDQAVNAINLFQEIYGIDYPFAKMDLVSDPIGGFLYGQAPPSIVYLGFGVFYPTARINLQSGGDVSSFQNTVVAHELGHQWWGSAVVNSNFGNYWFVETLAEYSAALYSEAMGRFGTKDPQKAAEKGWQAYMKDVEEWRRVILNNQNLFTSVQHSDTMMPGGDPGSRTAAIYNKGPYAFHMMRLLFGEEKFFKFLKDLAQEYEGKAIVTRDIQRMAEQSLCGTDAQGNPCTYDLEWFFDQWIRGVGMPEYAFNYTYRQAEDGTWVVEGDIKQRVVIGAEKTPLEGQTFRGRTMITVVDKNGAEYNVPVVLDAEVTPFAFKVPKEPLEVELNKNGGMLAHDVLVNRDF